MLAVGTDGALWATKLPAEGDAAHGWTAWASLGGRFASLPKISVLRQAAGPNPNPIPNPIPNPNPNPIPNPNPNPNPSPDQAAGGLRVVARAANRTFAQSALRLPANGGSGEWGGLSTLPGRTWASGAAVLPAADGGLEVSARAVDLAIWHVSVAADGTARREPQSLGGRFAATPAVTQGADGVLEVFARGFDQQIWSRAQQPAIATALASTPITTTRRQQQQPPQPPQPSPAVAQAAPAPAPAGPSGWGEWASLGGDFLPFPC